MTEEFFNQQIDRLTIRFGARAFDDEMVRVIAAEILPVSEDFFRRTVDTWVGTRKHTNPPLLTDFREARLTYERHNLYREAKVASNVFNYGLKEVLKRIYKVETLDEAFELERLKIKLGAASEDKGSK